jgi:hypothetical protein
MKKFYNLAFVLLLPVVFGLILTSGIQNHTGSLGGFTGSPGDMGANCTECHFGTAMTQEFWIISAPLITNGYEANETYNVVVAAFDADAEKFGFEATAETSAGIKTGTFDAGFSGLVQTINNSTAITHTAAGTIPLADTAIAWTFTWTAPSEPVGDITFYAAINAANGNGNNSGDQIYLSQFTAFPATSSVYASTSDKSPRFFPNPSSGLLNFDLSETNVHEITVFDLNGQIARKIPINETNGTIDLTDLQKGIYIIQTAISSQRILLF